MISAKKLSDEIKRINNRIDDIVSREEDKSLRHHYSLQKFKYLDFGNEYYETGPDGLFNRLPTVMYAMCSGRPMLEVTDKFKDGFWRIINDDTRKMYVVVDRSYDDCVLCEVDNMEELARGMCIDYDPSTENGLSIIPGFEIHEVANPENVFKVPDRPGEPRRPNWQKLSEVAA